MVAKLFVPSVRCPSCGYANDCDFRFCRRCGYSRKIVHFRQSRSVGINLDEIDTRMNQLWNFDQATGYSKQKDSLQKELENFLSGLPGKPSVAIVSPCDLCRFLAFKDRGGNFRYIVMVVPFQGNVVLIHANVPCDFHTRLLILTLVNSVLSSTQLVGMANGISV